VDSTGVHTPDRITSATGMGGGPYTYVYDGNGLRVKKSNAAGGTLYWRSLSGDVIAETDLNGTTTNEYIFFAGRRISRIDASGNVFFYYADHLGSTRTITDGSGNTCYDADFTPYGQEMVHTNTCPQNYKFTGYERDSETGLDYAMARFYNPRLGRFMSGDPLAGDSASPQSLNRYGYVLNSPTALIDPSGMIVRPMNFWEGNFPGIFDELGGGGAGCDEFDAVNPNSFCSQFVTPESDPTWSAFGWEFKGYIDGQYYDRTFDTWDAYADWSTTIAAMTVSPKKLFLQAESDCRGGAGREISYALKSMDAKGNITDAPGYNVTEHVAPRVPGGMNLLSPPTETQGNSSFDDSIGGLLTQDLLQTFTVAPASGGASVGVFVRDIDGNDYGTNGIYINHGAVLVNGKPAKAACQSL
jgi:RHS repeat-associated protein